LPADRTVPGSSDAAPFRSRATRSAWFADVIRNATDPDRSSSASA
jgi:hypothetical protein